MGTGKSHRALEREHFQVDPMTRTNSLYLVIGALVAVSAVLGYFLYQEQHKKEGFQISVGGHGISVEKK
jgi:RsiW-degrading membrane proteinase PrsW (M82 family)